MGEALRGTSLGDPYVIHLHDLGKSRGGIWTARPVAGDRDVEDQEEGAIEDPRFTLGEIGWCRRLVTGAVDVEADDVRLPLDREDMKIIGKSQALRQRVRGADAESVGVAGTVNCAVNGGGFAADVLQDVNLAAGRPASFFDIAPQHPARRPQPFAIRNLDPRFESAVRRGETIAGMEAGGGVFPRHAVGPGVRLAAGDDKQRAVSNDGVLWRAIGVVLQFTVAPTVAADVVCP